MDMTKRNYLVVDNLIIRPAEQSDSHVISQYFYRNKSHLSPWEPVRGEDFYTSAGWRQRLIKLVELHQLNLAYYFIIQQAGSDEVIGTISYSNLVRHPFHACYVGYSLDEEMQGNGIMRRALMKTNEWLFQEQNLHRIMAAYIPRNKRSGNVLEAAGFEYEGLAKDYLFINGQWEDHVLTALVNSDWQE